MQDHTIDKYDTEIHNIKYLATYDNPHGPDLLPTSSILPQKDAIHMGEVFVDHFTHTVLPKH